MEDIRKFYNMKRISISKYLNSIYKFYCNKSSINYKPIFKDKKIINLNNDIIKILQKNYLEYPHFKNSKQNIIAKTSMNTKTDKIEKLSKTLLFPSSALMKNSSFHKK